MVIRGIPTHSEGILVGHEVAKSQMANQTHTTSLIELNLDLVTYSRLSRKLCDFLDICDFTPLKVAHKSQLVFGE